MFLVLYILKKVFSHNIITFWAFAMHPVSTFWHEMQALYVYKYLKHVLCLVSRSGRYISKRKRENLIVGMGTRCNIDRDK